MGSMLKVPKMGKVRETEHHAEYQVGLFRKSLERKEFRESVRVVYFKGFAGSQPFCHSAGVGF